MQGRSSNSYQSSAGNMSGSSVNEGAEDDITMRPTKRPKVSKPSGNKSTLFRPRLRGPSKSDMESMDSNICTTRIHSNRQAESRQSTTNQAPALSRYKAALCVASGLRACGLWGVMSKAPGCNVFVFKEDTSVLFDRQV
eukprot:TRINITY_DN3020_c0_g1_i4.p2 TRINITY_DN3020_c0_g1~~TRINITY_DN3020_c0_g1_i4.p2  ORF type:complete len:139 (-),score=13.22 TRINITY_DN3020_c0_g1_i4:63-479(-)